MSFKFAKLIVAYYFFDNEEYQEAENGPAEKRQDPFGEIPTDLDQGHLSDRNVERTDARPIVRTKHAPPYAPATATFRAARHRISRRSPAADRLVVASAPR